MQNNCTSTVARISLILIFAATVSLSQAIPTKSPSPTPVPAPGNIQLPSGFIHERRRGIDSRVGAIVRADGFTINYDIGGMAANYADQYFPAHFERLRKQTHLNSNAIETQIQYLQDQVVWRQRQKINGDDVMVVMLKESKLIAAFVNSTANFVAKADSNDKIADFFLIVLTYQADSKNRLE